MGGAALGALAGRSVSGCGGAPEEQGVAPSGALSTGPALGQTKPGRLGADADDASDVPGSEAALSDEELLAPIDTFVVLCLENRSFDHYLGGSLRLREGRKDIRGLTGNETNLDLGGMAHAVYAMDNLRPDNPPHSWNAIHQAWNHGKNDGFIRVHPGMTPQEVMGFYLRAQLPIHHALADSFAVCDDYFCSVLGPTWPNRFYLHAGTSNGMQGNNPAFGLVSIWDSLASKGLTGVNFHHGTPWAGAGYGRSLGMENMDAFKARAREGTLPNFSIIDPEYFGNLANDDHPSNGDVPLAQALIADVYDTLRNSPQWNRCMFIVTYDEHGGFFDHVPPPLADDPDPNFRRMGFRVPTLVAGPYVSAGKAVHTTLEHCSVQKTLVQRFGLTPLTSRVAAANSLASVLDAERVKAKMPRRAPVLPKLDVAVSRLRNRVAPQKHSEILARLRDWGLDGRFAREQSAEESVMRQLKDAERRGILQLS